MFILVWGTFLWRFAIRVFNCLDNVLVDSCVECLVWYDQFNCFGLGLFDRLLMCMG